MKKILFPLCLFLTFAVILTDSLAQNGKSLYSFPLGVQAYTYRHQFPKDVVGTLDKMQRLGITELEGGAPKDMTPAAFKKLCDDRNISIIGTGDSYEALAKDPTDAIRKAKELGASYVIVYWIPHEKGNFTLENAKKAVADFNRIGKIISENGLTFCYHDHGYEFQPHEKGTLFDYLVQNTDPKYVSFEMDILWTQFGGGDPVALLKKYGDRFKLMHLKDLKKGVKGDLTGGTPAENDVALGKGQINIPEIIRQGKKLGIKHYFIEDESDREDEFVPVSIAYLKSL